MTSSLREPSHVAFSDESCWNINQFRTLALVSGPLDVCAELDQTLKVVASESGMNEFKWKELGGARERLYAEKLIKIIIPKLVKKDFRIDVMLWDSKDARHQVPRPDHAANLGRMYYHLLSNVLANRWPDEISWRLIPDEHSEVDWHSAANFVDRKAVDFELAEVNLFNHRPGLYLRKKFRVHEVQIGNSKAHRLLQVADFFAGIAAFSRNNYTEFENWQLHKEPDLFANLNDSHSKRDHERFRVLDGLNTECKSHKMRISLKSKRGLYSYENECGLNFWWYEPQHENDKAPSRM